MAKKTAYELFCANVMAWQESRGLTQCQAADVLGLTQPTYNRMIRGHCSPSLATLEAVARAMRKEPAELLK